MAGALRDFDVDALGAYLAGRIPGLRLSLAASRFSGGQSNPTYRLTDAQGQHYVLRMKPAGQLLPSAHAVDREYRVMKALEGGPVPVAQMHCLCEDAGIIGTPFYVMGSSRGGSSGIRRCPSSIATVEPPCTTM